MLVIGSVLCAYGNIPKQKEQDIVKLLGAANTMQQANQIFDQRLSSFGSNIQPDLERSIRSNFELKINDFRKTVISLYDELFSDEDIKRLISFYESSTGQKYNIVTSLTPAAGAPFASAHNSSPEKKKEITKLLKVIDVESYTEQAVRFGIPYVTADSLILNFDKHFSLDEIKKLVRFFESHLGTKLTDVKLLTNRELFNLIEELMPEAAALAENKSLSISVRPEEISAQALAAAPFLFTDRDSKGYLLPGNGTIVKPKDRAAFQIYDKVTVKPIGKASYKLGDTVDVLKPVKLVPFKGKSAQIVSRSGRGVVTGHTGKNIVIQLINMWDMIAGGERIAPTAGFKAIKYTVAPQTDSKIQAAVAARLEESTSPYLNQFFIIDKGTDAGINIGDFFKVFEKASGNKLSVELLEAQVINVGANSSTLAIRKIFKESLRVGDQAFLSRKNIPIASSTAD